MTVIFSVPETRLAQLVQRLYAGGNVLVEAWDRDNKVKLATGTLVATDNQIDTTTGTIKLRAEFKNEDYALFPNQFVNARALIDVRKGATVVPPAAVQLGNAGSFLYVVQADNTVAVRNVTLGPTDGTVVAIEKGLTPGEVVVIDGTDRLREGAKVTATARDAPTAAGSAPAAGAESAPGKSPAGAAHRHRRPTSGADQPSSG
jgi:multidrug efflux system membrane fusion protein